MSDDARPDNERRLLYPIPEAAHQLGIGRSTIYTLLTEGLLRSVTIRGRRLIPADALTEFVDQLGGE